MRLRWVVLSGVGLAAGYFAIFGGEYSLVDVVRLDRQREHELAQTAELLEQVEALRARADSLESDPFLLERIARERYGLIRDGERLYRIAEQPAPQPSGPAAAAAE